MPNCDNAHYFPLSIIGNLPLHIERLFFLSDEFGIFA